MLFYQKHIFICVNQKEVGKTCCAQSGGMPFFDHMKNKLQALDLHGAGKFRLTRSGCLGRCNEGPCIVIYPESVWYTYTSFDDIDEIVEEHLVKGGIVKRLLLPSF